MTHSRCAHTASLPIADLLDAAIKPSKSPPTNDVFLFSGNRHESVPRTLFLDRRITPIERNAWQVIKMMMDCGQPNALPTYERLRQYLTAMPCAAKASFETVARAITLLRLTRWISLARKRRLPNGQVQANLYILHDEPLTPHEAMQLDQDYFALVSKAMDHQSKAIQRVGELCFKEIRNDPTLGSKSLPTRLSVLSARFEQVISPSVQKLSTDQSDFKSEASQLASLRNQYGLPSESESGLKPAKNRQFLNPKSDGSSSSSNLYKKTTAKKERLHIQLPERFLHLPAKQQNLCLSAMHHLDLTLQQQIFIEWDRRCQFMTIRKPAAYLLGIVQKALQGDLNALNHAPLELPVVPVGNKPSSPPEESPADRETAKRYIHKLRSIVSRGTLNPSPEQAGPKQ